MANWRFHSRASIDPYAPRGHGTCDKCSQINNLSALYWQMEYRGNALMRTGFRVCDKCLDIPYQGRRPIIIPADPVPLLDPRPENFLLEENTNAQNNPEVAYWDESGLLWDDGVSEWGV